MMNIFSTLSLRRLWPVFALIATLAWASNFDKSSPSGPDVPYFDKVAHFFVFGLMATLWYRCLAIDSKRRSRWILAIGLVFLYGVIDEWIQFYNPNRSSDALDWVADASGAATALFVYRSWRLYRCLLETRIVDLFRLKIADVD